MKHKSAKKIMTLALSAFLLGGAGFSIVTINSTPVVAAEVKATLPTATPINQIFPDTELAGYIASALSKSRGDTVTQAQLNSITELEIANVTSITGLNYLNNLETFIAMDNEITDITPLAGLVQLKTLNLQQNNITDITALKNLTNLTRLHLWKNNINSIDSLINLSNLELVDLSSNPIQDLSPLHNSTKIRTLSLNRIPLHNLDLLTHFPNLQHLELDNTGISDISQLANFPTMLYLSLDNNNISNVSPISNFQKLETLRLNDNNITDISSFKNLNTSSTLELALNGNHIADISPLVSATMVSAGFPIYANGQTLELPTVIESPSISIMNTITTGNGTPVTPATISASGTYSASTITWNNISNFKDLSYTFKTTFTTDAKTPIIFSGTVTQPTSPEIILPVITADTAITYPVDTNKSELKFFVDIHASTDTGTTIFSDFKTVVDFTTPGDYLVTLTSQDGMGNKAVPVQITVTITALAETTDNNTSSENNSTTDNNTTHSNVVSDTNTNSSSNNTALPITGQNLASSLLFGSILLGVGSIIVKRKK